MKQNEDTKIFLLAFVLLSALFVLGETLFTPAYPEPVLLELPASGQAAAGGASVQDENLPASSFVPDAEPEGFALPQQADGSPPPQMAIPNEEGYSPYIAKTEDSGESRESGEGRESREEYAFPMSINHANREQLMYVKGVGEKTADKILGYLAQYGPVSSVEELEAIKGIGPKTVEKLKEYFYAP